MHHRGSSSPFDAFFLDVKEGVDEMVKFLANEPSVGLFFVQQHAQTSMSYLLDIKDKVGEKTREVALHTEDVVDSICSVRSMKEYGIPIADEMIKDINRSLLITSTSQPKRGVIRNPSWGVQISNSSSQDLLSYSIGSDQRGGSSDSYLSTMFDSAKQKAARLGWSQTDAMAKDSKSDQLSSVTPSQATGYVTPTTTDTECDELPLSSQLLDYELDDTVAVVESLYIHDMPSMLQDYDKFKYEREAKLKEWLQEPHRHGKCNDSSDYL